MRQRHALWMLPFLILILAACDAGGPSLQLTPLSVTLEPAQGLQFVAGCTTRDLENWLENTDFLVAEFVNTMNRGAAEPPGAQWPIILRLTQLRDQGLAVVPAPDACAVEAHNIIATMMEQGLIAFQAYANGEDIDLAPALSSAESTLIEVQTLQTLLHDRLREQINTTPAG